MTSEPQYPKAGPKVAGVATVTRLGRYHCDFPQLLNCTTFNDCSAVLRDFDVHFVSRPSLNLRDFYFLEHKTYINQKIISFQNVFSSCFQTTFPKVFDHHAFMHMRCLAMLKSATFNVTAHLAQYDRIPEGVRSIRLYSDDVQCAFNAILSGGRGRGGSGRYTSLGRRRIWYIEHARATLSNAGLLAKSFDDLVCLRKLALC